MENMVEIYLADHDEQRLSRVGRSEDFDSLMEILQYLLDSMGEEKFDNNAMVKHVPTERWADMQKLRKRFCMRKRTPDERLANKRIWRLNIEEEE